MSISVQWPAPLAQMDPPSRHLTLAVIVSLALHGVLLSIHFGLPEAIKRGTDMALDIVLVNSKSAHRPKDAQVRAQTNLDGGGNTDENRRATTPLPPSQQVREGDDLVDAKRRVTTLESQQQQMLTRLQSQRTVAVAAERAETAPPAPPTVSGFDMANRAMAIAKLEAQIDKQTDDYNKRPRRKTIGVRAESAVEAQYLEDWRQKIERVGNLNYPEAAKGKLYGSLIVWVEIDSRGLLINSEIHRSSGHKILDDAALRIVRMAAPYAPFPSVLKNDMDIIGFARTWTFTRADGGDALSSSSMR